MFGPRIKTDQIVKNHGFFRLSLSDISESNYEDPISFWEDRGGFSRIINSLSGSQAFLLRHALGKYTCTDSEKSTGDSVYTSVILKIPKSDYQGLLLRQKLNWLSQELARIHYKHMKGKLLGERYPTYLVVPDEKMAAGKCEFLFGRLIFVSGPEDKLKFSLEIGLNTHEMSPVQWEYPGAESIPAGMYEEQKGTCIGLSPSPYTIEDSLLRNHTYSQLFIIPEIGNPEKFMVFTGTEYYATLDLEGKNDESLKIVSNNFAEDASQIPDNLVLNVKRVCHTDEKKEAAISKADSEEQNLDSEDLNDRTIITCPKEPQDLERTLVANNLARLKLCGYLLPRIDGIYSKQLKNGTPLQSYSLWFDKQGEPYPRQPAEAELTISASSTQESIFVRRKGEDSLHKLKNALDEGSIRILPVPDSLEGFSGLLEIPIQTESHFLKIKKEITLGRDSGSAFPLNKFNVENSLRCEGDTFQSDFDRALVSNKHAKVMLLDNATLQITQISTSLPVYILDEHNLLSKRLPATPEKPSEPALVYHGQKIILGSYILEFSGQPQKKSKPAVIRESSGTQEGIKNGFIQLLNSYCKHVAIMNCKAELTDMGLAIVGYLNNSDKDSEVSDYILDIRIALQSISAARNRWAHAPLEYKNEPETELENLLAYKRSLRVLSKHLFDNEFIEKNDVLIKQIENKLALGTKQLVSEMGTR